MITNKDKNTLIAMVKWDIRKCRDNLSHTHIPLTNKREIKTEMEKFWLESLEYGEGLLERLSTIETEEN